jgi:hypothetical protein
MSDTGVKVKDHDDLRRDPHSKAIVSVDKEEYRAYLNRKQKNERLVHLENKMFDLQNDISDIKNLLQQIVN